MPDRKPLDPEIDAALAHRLLVSAPSAELAHVVLAVMVAAFLTKAVPWTFAVPWAVAVILVVVLGLPWRRRALRGGFAPARVYRGIRTRVTIDAILWGVGAAWLALHADLLSTAIVLIVLAGLVAGALVTLMPDPVAFRLLAACILAPPAAALLAVGRDREHFAVASLIVVFGLFESLVHERSFRQLVEREQARLRIDEQDERLRALEGATTEGIVLHEDGRVVEVNDAFLRMLGYERAEVLGRSVLDFCAPKYRARIQEAMRAGLQEPYEAEGLRKDGATVVAELAGRATHYRGRVMRMVAIRDITTRKRLEAQIQESLRLQAIGQLAGNVAHDFNNILTALLTGSDVLRAALPADSPAREDVQAIAAAAQRGADVTRRLLAFSRRQPIDLRPLSLAALLADLKVIARRVVPDDITIDVATDGADSTVEADPGAVTQIVLNLVANAHDAMPLGGRIGVTVGRATLTAAQCEARGWGEPGPYVTLTVTDSGAGMDAEAQRRIFDPFFTTKPVGTGAGLGMSLVYGLMKQHGGHIDVASEAGRGTTVRLYFPHSTRPLAEVAAAAAPAPAGGSEAILLIESDDGVRTAAAKALRRFGYTVTPAANGVEAIEALTGGRTPDLIVADAVMPGLGGPELLRKLSELGAAPPVLFTGGYADRDLAALSGGGARKAFIAKPWAVADLLRRIRETLAAASG